MNTRGSQLYGVGADVEVRRINLQLIMQLQKRNDKVLTLRALTRNLKEHDAQNQGALDQETFELALKKFNLFPTVVEVQALMNFYNCSGTHKFKMIDYNKFVQGLRLPLEGRRLAIAQEAWKTIQPEAGAQCMTMAQAKAAFKFENFEMFANAIELPTDDDQVITMDQWHEF